VSSSNAPVARITRALVLPFRWLLVLLAVLVSVIVVPIVELVADIFGLVRRAFGRLP
jgi:hypothetical protein